MLAYYAKMYCIIYMEDYNAHYNKYRKYKYKYEHLKSIRGGTANKYVIFTSEGDLAKLNINPDTVNNVVCGDLLTINAKILVKNSQKWEIKPITEMVCPNEHDETMPPAQNPQPSQLTQPKQQSLKKVMGDTTKKFVLETSKAVGRDIKKSLKDYNIDKKIEDAGNKLGSSIANKLTGMVGSLFAKKKQVGGYTQEIYNAIYRFLNVNNANEMSEIKALINTLDASFDIMMLYTIKKQQELYKIDKNLSRPPSGKHLAPAKPLPAKPTQVPAQVLTGVTPGVTPAMAAKMQKIGDSLRKAKELDADVKANAEQLKHLRRAKSPGRRPSRTPSGANKK